MNYERGSYIKTRAVFTHTLYIHDWAISEMEDSPKIGELRNGAKTKAGPLEAEQLSRFGNTHIALVR